MKTMSRMFWALFVFFLVMVPFYGIWNKWAEAAGPVALLLTSLMMALAGWYIGVTEKKFTNQPEDNPEAHVEDSAGEYGFFTPYSWWPLWLGLSCAGLFAGLAVGWWLFMIFAVMGGWALIGWVFEHYKGEHAN